MPYVEHGMWEVLDVLQRIRRGESRRQIERVTGRSRSTIERYVTRAKGLGWDADGEEPTEELAAKILAGNRPGAARRVKSDSVELLEPHAAQIEKWLKPHDGYKRGLKLTKIHSLLTRQGVDVSYWAVRRFVHSRFDYGKNASTVRVAEVAPGELAEVDFGRLGKVYDPETGRNRIAHALIVTLVFSRHQYVHVSFGQKLGDLIESIENAWEFFGGVTTRVVLDNLKAAVTKADRYDPEFQRTFNEYANQRGFIIDAAVVRHPKGKPHVERQVQYVRDNFFRGESWLNLEHVQREARRWCLQTAGLRVHGTTRQKPFEQFEVYEKPALKTLTGERFDTPLWGEPKVHIDHHIQFGSALYSVPHVVDGVRTKGKKVTVRGDSKLVRIYYRGQFIKVHPRKAKGGRSTDYSDYPPEKTAYAMRDAERISALAKAKGPSIGEMTAALLSGDFPWAHLRKAQKLVRMTDKYGAKRVDDACRRALSFDLVDVRRVERILVRAIHTEHDEPQHDGEPSDNVVQLSLKYLRPSESLVHHQDKEQEDGSPTLA